MWEPVLERTHLCFTVSVDAPVITLDIEGKGTIRLNITGAFLQALLRVLNPVGRDAAVVVGGDAGVGSGTGAVEHVGRHNVDHILVHNRLGVAWTLVDSTPAAAAAAATTTACTGTSTTGTGTSISTSGTITLNTGASGYLSLQPLCRFVSLHSAGKLPLTQLPIRVPGTTLYQLHSDVGYGRLDRCVVQALSLALSLSL